MTELLIATNPDPGSSPRYLIRLPLGEGMVFRASDTWPRTKAVFCYPVGLDEWPAEPDLVERVADPLVRTAGCGDRPGAGPGAGAPVAVRLHQGSRA